MKVDRIGVVADDTRRVIPGGEDICSFRFHELGDGPVVRGIVAYKVSTLFIDGVEILTPTIDVSPPRGQ